MVIMTVIFGRVAGLPSEGNAPYVMMVFAGLLPWQFFSPIHLLTEIEHKSGAVEGWLQ
jgi:ABC-type polysaccharide/polyol phosphate export permease